MATTRNITDTHKVSNTAGKISLLRLQNTVNAATMSRTTNDVDQLFDVYPGDYVMRVFAQVLTADATVTFDVGDGADVDGYIDGAKAATTGWNANSGLTATAKATETKSATKITSTVNVTGYSNGKLYTTTDTIDVKWLSAAPDTAKVQFTAVIMRPE